MKSGLLKCMATNYWSDAVPGMAFMAGCTEVFGDH